MTTKEEQIKEIVNILSPYRFYSTNELDLHPALQRTSEEIESLLSKQIVDWHTQQLEKHREEIAKKIQEIEFDNRGAGVDDVRSYNEGFTNACNEIEEILQRKGSEDYD
jgi:hypothetical protein